MKVQQGRPPNVLVDASRDNAGMNGGGASHLANRFHASTDRVGTVNVEDLHLLTSPTYALFVGEHPTAKSNLMQSHLDRQRYQCTPKKVQSSVRFATGPSG